MSKLLSLLKKNAIALLIEFTVIGALDFAIPFWRNVDADFCLCDPFDKVMGQSDVVIRIRY